MTPHLVILSVLAAALLTSCDDSVSLEYSTRAEAEAESLFARGWLPEIIPASSENISMRNDLDLNISNGEFKFDPADHDQFIKQLKRTASEDKKRFLAYSYEDWSFWISNEKNFCRFYMRLNRNRQQSEQGGAGNPAKPGA